MPNRLGSFYEKRLGNHVHCTLISTFLFLFIKSYFSYIYMISSIPINYY